MTEQKMESDSTWWICRYASRKWGGENCHLKKVVAFFSDVYSRKWLGRENSLEPKNRSKKTSKSDFSRKWKTRLPRFLEEIRTGIDQRKLGSNTSMLRANRTVRLDLDKGCCETLRYITIHHKRIDLDEGWCETLHYITTHHKKLTLMKGGVRLYTT